MAASKTAFSNWNFNAYQERLFSFVSDDSGDWVVLDVPGVVAGKMHGDTGAELAFTYGTLNVHNKGAAYSATTTSIVYNEASPGTTVRSAGGYYLLCSTGVTGEIMYVVADSGYTADTGTLTVIRGCLGKTAALAGVADDCVLNVLNVIVTGADIDGRAFLRGVVLPTEYKANIFKE